ncbi:(2Fe-2S)-binding protein [uncultured Brachyspira sp.]|uniref:(2Fe-2S)-binding protein n=1 Tax=uncultured Brachyspira sp. TaxID=221953 RepID=UPI0025E200A1|nr:(2Fe-2S)-binding protein [uncultured Brachyspira sp.]
MLEKTSRSTLCFCKNIKYKEIINAIKDNKLETLEDVMHRTKAGITCWSCRGDIKDLLAEYKKTGNIRIKE